MYTIRKIFKFEMAHQLKEAYSDCCKKCIHGHSYVLELYFKSKTLDKTGMIIDFGKIKDQLNDYLGEWDHALVMPSTFSKSYLTSLETYNHNLKVVDYNPTAENMAKDIYDHVKSKIKTLSKVRIHETATGYAEYEE